MEPLEIHLDRSARVATLAMNVEKPVNQTRAPSPLAFKALLVFVFLYYGRPEDIIPGLSIIPLSKIVAVVAAVALVAVLNSRKGKFQLPLEIKLLLALMAQMTITIPFAYWKGGAFNTVFSRFGKGVVVVLLIGMVVESLPQLRKLLYVQVAAMSFMTVASLIMHRTEQGRLVGALGGVFENPNDLAVNLAINWPLCLGFVLLARGPIKKGLWALSLGAMLVAVMATYSRSGFLAMALGGLIALWHFGIRGRRIGLVLLAAVVGVGLLLALPSRYRERLSTILTMKEDVGPNGEMMSGSSGEARRELLRLSFEMMKRSPLVGVGPGNFPVVSGAWRVAHNTYTEMGAEAGVPALILFLLYLWAARRNLRRALKSTMYQENKEFRIYAGALAASFGAYVLGAFFSDTAYNLFPYFLVAYTTGLYRIAYPSPEENRKNRYIRRDTESVPQHGEARVLPDSR
jgi:O-antigen ligase